MTRVARCASCGGRTVAAAVLLALLASCDRRTESGPPTATPGESMAVVRFGDAAVTAEIADTAPERQRGLMGRRSLASDLGMLFLFESRTSGGFWMKNTLIPLSIAYMVETSPGRYRVVAIRDMVPCRRDPCPTYSPGRSYDAALEVNRGWFERHDVDVGAEARLDLPE